MPHLVCGTGKQRRTWSITIDGSDSESEHPAAAGGCRRRIVHPMSGDSARLSQCGRRAPARLCAAVWLVRSPVALVPVAHTRRQRCEVQVVWA
jgi:hypothetical protein